MANESNSNHDYELEVEGISLVCSTCGRHYWITPAGEFRHLADPLPEHTQCVHVGMRFKMLVDKKGYLQLEQIR